MSSKQRMVRRVEQYLTCRHRLGFELKIEGAELRRFGRYADTQGHRGVVTTDLAVAWAKLPTEASPLYWARRLNIVRRFAQFELIDEPSTQVPPPGLLGQAYRRPPVHIYTESEITSLLEAASRMGPARGLRPRTFVTLLGLLTTTGLRVSEALRLTNRDIDWDQRRLMVRESKFKGSRLLPLHDSTLKALRDYSQLRRRYHGPVQCDSFFLTERATPLKYWRTLMAFSQLRRSLDWDRLVPCPRMHDLRHTFAVRCLLRWYQTGENVGQKILALQTYLGHKKVTDTYWYLTAIPDLMAEGASRFERFARKEGASSR